MDNNRVNINIGILGHVDSGKTTLAKALSTELSTAALDKHPESQRRGITIDLGFSAFMLSFEDKTVQFTLVDCPGHASLIRTVIGGAQIIDLMFLVIDAAKGIQTQTSECLVIGEILAKKLVVVMNKSDLLSNEQLQKSVEKVRKAMKVTKFGKDVPLACVSAGTSQVQELVDLLREMTPVLIQERALKSALPFLFSIDHCFPIKGQGTVITGTALQGTVNAGDEVEVSAQNARRKVKSMQMFHKPVQRVTAGDRAGLCLTQFDSEAMERGWAFSPGLLTEFNVGVARIQKIRFFKSNIKSRTKFHISIGHTTVIASVLLFLGTGSSSALDDEKKTGSITAFDTSAEYEFLEELGAPDGECYALLQFEQPLLAPEGGTFIGSNLSVDAATKSCRIGFWGAMLFQQKVEEEKVDDFLSSTFKIFKWKSKTGTIDRVVDSRTIIGRDLFGKSSDFSPFVGLKVQLSGGETGIIESGFGKAGKFKCIFREPLPLEEVKGKPRISNCTGEIHLKFKKFIYVSESEKKKFFQ